MTVHRPKFLSSLKCRPLESAVRGACPPLPFAPASRHHCSDDDADADDDDDDVDGGRGNLY